MYSVSNQANKDGSLNDKIVSPPGSYDLSFPEHSLQSVSVIVPCLESPDQPNGLVDVLLLLLPYLKYPDMELVLVIGGNKPFDLSEIQAKLTGHFRDESCSINPKEAVKLFETKAKVVQPREELGIAGLINIGVSSSKGEFVCLIDDSTSDIKHRIYGRDGNWLGQMVAYAGHEKIGAVGGLIVDREQSVVISSGQAYGGDGTVADLHHGEAIESAGYFARLLGSSNCTALRLGCLVARRKTFDEIGGLDEKIPDDFVDLDYGLRLRAKGYRSVVLSQYHFSQDELSISEKLGTANNRSSDLERQRFFQKWFPQLPAQDPFYSPNLRFVGNSAKFYLNLDDLPEEILASTLHEAS